MADRQRSTAAIVARRAACSRENTRPAAEARGSGGARTRHGRFCGERCRQDAAAEGLGKGAGLGFDLELDAEHEFVRTREVPETIRLDAIMIRWREPCCTPWKCS